jgi:putative polyhydroxyalkanoate system protein
LASEIRILRPHTLGLARARKLAWAWAEKVERDYGMQCTVIEGEDEDVVEFARPGVSGQVTVAADRFDLNARLGLLLGAFSGRIEQEIGKQFDALLGPARKKAAKKR